jgi:hypothetical protein
MQEDLKQKFVLLSKVAKEKKYAQEYLGLLARRGDIGSIRIGKRWYTTWQWFEEFLENSQKKKNEVLQDLSVEGMAKTDASGVAAKVEKVENISQIVPEAVESFPNIPQADLVPVHVAMGKKLETKSHEEVVAEHGVKIHFSKSVMAKNEVEKKMQPVESNVKISLGKKENGNKIEIRKMLPSRPIEKTNIIRVRTNIDSRKRIEFSKTPNFSRVNKSQTMEPRTKESQRRSIEERNRLAVPYPEVKLKKKADVYSPVISEVAEKQTFAFPRLAFALSFAIILFLIGISGYFIWSGGLLQKGTVAGASDQKMAGFSGIETGSDYYLGKSADKMKESLSISKAVVEVAKENVKKAINKGN